MTDKPSQKALAAARAFHESYDCEGTACCATEEQFAAELDAFAAEHASMLLDIWRKELAKALGIAPADGVLGKALNAILDKEAERVRAEKAEARVRELEIESERRRSQIASLCASILHFVDMETAAKILAIANGDGDEVGYPQEVKDAVAHLYVWATPKDRDHVRATLTKAGLLEEAK